MSTPVALTAIQGGITRLRTKGAALRNSLYDLLNAYVTMQGTIQPRGGTIRNASVSQVTKGLIKYKGMFHVFAHTPTGVPSGYQCDVLVNPTDATLTVAKIHFVAPFLGFLYVVAEFSDGSIFHYWLQSNGTWTANTVYLNGDFVSPSTPDGFAFQAVRLAPPNSVWSPESAISVDQIVEPTTYNGYMFQAIAVSGATPHTGQIEPAWPTAEGAQVQEFGDFGTASAPPSSVTATAQSPGSAITDRYGNAGVFSSQLGVEPSTAPTVTAQTTVSTWRAGTLYQPGAVVQPSTGQGAFIGAIPNGDFEAGDDGNWVKSAGASIGTTPAPYQGTFNGELICDHSTETLTMNTFGAVTPGQSVSATCYVKINATGSDLVFNLKLRWYDGSDTFLSATTGPSIHGSGGWVSTTVTGNAPSGAARCRVQASASNGTSARGAQVDIMSWTLETPAAVSNFLFEAVQAAAGSSGSTEPTWPTIDGNTVVDGSVTWEAVGSSIITWQAIPIMKSGASEPTWPTTVGNSVADGSGLSAMTWTCASRQITDPKCPNTKYVAINSSKVFCGDADIIAFCATTNPLDWSTANDAGFLPFGLNNFGSEDVAGLNIYRSNLVAFNGLGYQMWQTDEDPADMAILDGSPVGCTFSKTPMPVNNDLVFFTTQGFRSIGVAGASANLQAGNFGKQVDPLALAFLQGLTGIQEPRGLFFPGSGQYWGIFANQALVLTMNGATATTMSWSRYSFPYEITDWTVGDGVLYLRVIGPSGSDFVWQYDPLVFDPETDALVSGTLTDDTGSGFGNIAIANLIWWPYLDFGPIGLEKSIESFDLSCDGEVSVSIGYNQKDLTQVTDAYVIDGDTLPGVGAIPFPVTGASFQFRLSFTPGQAWEWQVLNVNINPENQT